MSFVEVNNDKSDGMALFRKRKCYPRNLLRFAKKNLFLWFVLLMIVVFVNWSQTPNHAPSAPLNQEAIDYIASYLKVQCTWTLNSQLKIQLINNGSEDILSNSWEIYFSQISLPLTPMFISKTFKVVKVNGFLFKLYPTLDPGKVVIPKHNREIISVPCTLQSKYFIFPNWYIVAPEMEIRGIASTSLPNHGDMVVMPLTYGSLQRFLDNKEMLKNVGEKFDAVAPKLVIPTPLRIERKNISPEYLVISSDWSIFHEKGLETEASMLAESLGIKFVRPNLPPQRNNSISLRLVPDRPEETKLPLPSGEGYKVLMLPSNRVVVEAGSPAGIFYGIQTIISLCRNNKSTDDSSHLPVLNVTDAPLYPYRGLMLDVARHFFDVDFVKKLITLMSSYKMNYLHLHLTDDEGWRIQIPGISQLTSIGSRPTAKYGSQRKFNFLHAYLGNLPLQNTEESPDENRQYYSADEYSDILTHAARHHVTVVPELDFPGHSHAALVSMRSVGRKIAKVKGVYNLEDVDDVSDDASINDVADTVINVCMDSAINFMRTVVKTMVEYHKVIQPLKMIHLGGDEVSETALVKSPVCKEFLSRNPVVLREYVANKLLELGSELNVKVILWEGNHRQTTFKSPEPPIVHFWMPSEKRNEVLRKYVEAGINVVLSEADVFYLDHPSEPCAHENGLRWATQKINEFDIFKYQPPRLCTEPQQSCDGRIENVLGIQANLWGELIWNKNMAEEMLFPRLLVVAERAWHRPAWGNDSRSSLEEDWLAFAKALVERELVALDKHDVNYKLPNPGAKLKGGHIYYNTLLPGLQVMATIDGGRNWVAPEELKSLADVSLATMSANQERMSRRVPLKH